MQLPRPSNLGISRQLGSLIAIAGAMMALTAIMIVAILNKAESAPAVAAVVGSIGAIALALVSALKSTETADTAARTHRTVAYTASQNATLQQLVTAHCGAICPLETCPLKDSDPRDTPLWGIGGQR